MKMGYARKASIFVAPRRDQGKVENSASRLEVLNSLKKNEGRAGQQR